MKQRTKRILGVSFWALLLVGGAVAAAVTSRSDRGQAVRLRQSAQQIARFVGRGPTETQRVDPIGRLRVGDPVFLAEDDGGFRQVGRVSAVPGGDPPAEAGTVEIAWYDSEVAADACQMFQHHSSGRLSEMVQTLMPPEKRRRISERLAAAMSAHGEALARELVPLVEESLRRSLPVIEDEFRRSIARHQHELDQAADRFHRELVQKRLIPMAKQEILPVVKRHGQPPAEAIGREIWDRASLFRFGWRALYDKSPLPQRDLLREEWARFVEDEAVPVMESHMEDLVVAIERTLRDLAANQAVRDELAAAAGEIAGDPQSRALVQAILKETLVDNQRLREVWKQVWTSDRAQRALAIGSERLEPIIRQIGDEIFGSEADGIDPHFARVLRSQILRKDRRWIVAWHTGASNGVVEPASRPMPYPVVYLAERRRPEPESGAAD